MVLEFGTPTLFLTFSCAEYDSHDIADYLKTVNNVPEGYDVGKLYTEDPISVSRQFSLKFHAFFNKIIIKGKVLGAVDHYMWKKEYQNRGAPHYHVLLWIRDAPVIGVDDPDKVMAWIEDRITCKLPDKESDPELHALVTKCKHKIKRGGVFVTTCKSNFPRTPQEKTVLHCVEEKLKKRQRIYELARSESKVRVNDYNPLLLLLWQAKAEKCSMQEVWQEIGESGSIYSCLWKFGMRALRSRECGLYEASDLLLGDHLLEKSESVVYVPVEMPHKRSRRLKNHDENHDELVNLAEKKSRQ